MQSFLFTLVLLVPSFVSAHNDWNTPCLQGTCSYHTQNSTHHDPSTSASITLNGSTNAISDLTPAAGWTILNCDKNSTAQDIRAVCTGKDTDCNHVYNNGAVGTIVRLPEECGRMPFARISAEWQHENQTVPEHITKQLSRRSGRQSHVRGISLDVDFAKIDPKVHGEVNLAVRGVTGQNATVAGSGAVVARSLDERSIFDKIGSALKSVGNDIKNGVEDAGNDIKNAGSTAVNAIKSGASTAENEAQNIISTIKGTTTGIIGTLTSSLNNINLDKSGTSQFGYSKSVTIAQQMTQCPATASITTTYQAQVAMSVNAAVSGNVNYEFDIKGGLVPPKISDFQLVASLNAEVDGSLSVKAQGAVSVSTGMVKIFETGLPGLDFPGVLSIGPTFGVYTEGLASAQANIQENVDFAWTISGTKIYFPPNKGSSIGTFAPKDHKAAMLGDPTIAATGSASAHLIPMLTFGLNAMNGAAEADIKVQLDASTGINLSLNKSLNTAFVGCADIYTSLVASAGATANFFGLFDQNTNVPLWSKKFDLWNKCFSKRAHSRAFPTSPVEFLGKRGNSVTCSGLNGPGKMQTAVQQTIPAASIH